jgi:molecular chaperone GrpE
MTEKEPKPTTSEDQAQEALETGSAPKGGWEQKLFGKKDSAIKNKDSASQEILEVKAVTISEAEYQKLQRESVEYRDKYIRLAAEFDNARKRNERDRQEFVKYANEQMVIEFLSILDDLERSLEAAVAKHEDYEAFRKGIEMVMAHIYDMLKKNGVKSVESVGKIFDPHCHEVLMQTQTLEVQDGTIVEEFQKGYYLADRVVRTAKVKVAVAPKGDMDIS